MTAAAGLRSSISRASAERLTAQVELPSQREAVPSLLFADDAAGQETYQVGLEQTGDEQLATVDYAESVRWRNEPLVPPIGSIAARENELESANLHEDARSPSENTARPECSATIPTEVP